MWNLQSSTDASTMEVDSNIKCALYTVNRNCEGFALKGHDEEKFTCFPCPELLKLPKGNWEIYYST